MASQSGSQTLLVLPYQDASNMVQCDGMGERTYSVALWLNACPTVSLLPRTIS